MNPKMEMKSLKTEGQLTWNIICMYRICMKEMMALMADELLARS